MIICIPVPIYIIFSCFYDPFWVKNDIGTGIHIMIIHYNCTIGNILLHSFLLICHPYPPSFHEMIFILNLLVEGAQKMLIYTCLHYVRMRISADRAPAE